MNPIRQLRFFLRKSEYYAQLALNPNLFTHYNAVSGPVRVLVLVRIRSVASRRNTLDALREELAAQAVELRLVKTMDGV
jgi:hypothetical protein